MPQLLVALRLMTAIVAVLLIQTALGAPFSYIDVANQSREVTIDPGKRQVTVGHRGMSAEFCGPGAMACFKSQELTFAIPRQFDASKQSAKWTFDGHQYVASRADDIEILGKTLRIFFIDAPDHAPPMRYWYEPAHGLVAMQPLSASGSLLLLREECGFAAAFECPAAANK